MMLLVLSCRLIEVKFVGIHCLHVKREGEGFSFFTFLGHESNGISRRHNPSHRGTQIELRVVKF
jgi:hypothetical protein